MDHVRDERSVNVLCLSGMSPAVVTETLYALLRDAPDSVIGEVHVVTTIPGRRLVESRLAGDAGALALLFRQFGRPVPLLRVHVIERDGQPLEDIRTRDENAAAADFCCSLVRKLTARDMPALHVSLAGGRKTMGFHLGYALSLYARRADRLSHVLVNEPWERTADFMFPGLGNEAPPHAVQIADVPFVRLRDGMPLAILEARLGFAALVAAAQTSVSDSDTKASFDGRQLLLGGTAITLKPILLGFYLWLLSLRAGEDSHTGFVRFTDPAAAGLLPFLKRHRRLLGMDPRSLEALERDGPTREFFEEKKARVNQALGQQMGLARHPYVIVQDGKRPQTRMGIPLARGSILLSL